MGQSIKPLVKKLEDNNRLVHILSITTGVFIGMTLLGFYDNQNLLGFGPYLFMGLLGLLLVSLVMYFVKIYGENTELQIMYVIDTLGVGLFSVYISYHIQIIKEHAKKCQTLINRGISPDYPIESITLFLDVINIFTYLADANK
jgi:FtsH-binding integral membrane protein